MKDLCYIATSLKSKDCLHQVFDNLGMYVCMFIYIYAIMKTMCPPGYDHHSFVVTLGHMMYGTKICVCTYIPNFKFLTCF